MAGKLHENTRLRIQKVCDITRRHYEQGNLARCYKQVWRHYVFPVYPMCYHTFLHYLSLGMEEYKSYKAPPVDTQPSLFDNLY